MMVLPQLPCHATAVPHVLHDIRPLDPWWGLCHHQHADRDPRTDRDPKQEQAFRRGNGTLVYIISLGCSESESYFSYFQYIFFAKPDNI